MGQYLRQYPQKRKPPRKLSSAEKNYLDGGLPVPRRQSGRLTFTAKPLPEPESNDSYLSQNKVHHELRSIAYVFGGILTGIVMMTDIVPDDPSTAIEQAGQIAELSTLTVMAAMAIHHLKAMTSKPQAE